MLASYGAAKQGRQAHGFAPKKGSQNE